MFYENDMSAQPITFLRTNSQHPDFIYLVRQLDAYLAEMDGSEHGFYAQFNQSDSIQHVLLAYINRQPVGCGAIRKIDLSHTEVKRMFTLPAFRGLGIASEILRELENWALELGFEACQLETGVRQKEAIQLYEKQGYTRVENYGPYAGKENSICYRKILNQDAAG